MAFQCDLVYVRTSNRAKILVAEACFGLLGGIINAFWGGLAAGLLTFLFWSTLVLSGLLVLLHICNIYDRVQERLGAALWRQIEISYIGGWILLYLMATILSFINFGGSNVIAYIELVLFAAEALITYRSAGQPEFTTQISQQNVLGNEVQML